MCTYTQTVIIEKCKKKMSTILVLNAIREHNHKSVLLNVGALIYAGHKPTKKEHPNQINVDSIRLLQLRPLKPFAD